MSKSTLPFGAVLKNTNGSSEVKGKTSISRCHVKFDEIIEDGRSGAILL